jgi:probable HAF family extracellular repeat protein
VFSSANGVNDLGQIVGSFTDSSGTHGFLDTNGLITVIDLGFGGDTMANGISNAGQIVGSYVLVPEPASLLFAASGLAAMAALKRRHARRRSD